MRFFRRQQAPAADQLATSRPPAPIDLTAAIETVLVKAVDSQMNLYERISRLTAENLQLALQAQQKSQKRVGGLIRSRGAARNRRGQLVQCRLCSNPAIPDPTPAEIVAHVNHRTPAKPSPADPPPADEPEFPYAVRDGAVHVDVPESAVETDAQGNEVVECAGCLNGQHQHGHGHQVH
jgi:hypothetical protein